MKIKEIKASYAFDGVERTEIGGPPSAFRIWRAGDNATTHGPTVFTERSAALILQQQSVQQNRFSVDINHLSLDKTAPLENQRAVGFFSVEVRDGELWAVDCEWTDLVKNGLSKNPPEWKYHSPAYDIDPETGEVLGLTNLALTNNPATFNVTALATSGACKDNVPLMKLEDIKAAFEGADPDKKAAAWAAIAKAMASDGEPSEKEAAKASDDEAPESKKEAAKASDDEPEKKDAKASDDEPEKKDAKASKTLPSDLASMDKALRDANKRIAELEKVNHESERKTLLASVEASTALRKLLATKPIAEVREICATLPAKAPKTTSTEAVQATRGAGQESGGSALPPDQKEELDRRMGVKSVTASVIHEGVHQIFPAQTPAETRAMLASKKAGK